MTHSASAIGLDEMIEDRRETGHLGQSFVHIEVPFGKPIEEVYDGVHNGPVLGSGISGLVRLVTHKATGIKYAVKVLDLVWALRSEGIVKESWKKYLAGVGQLGPTSKSIWKMS